MNTRPDYITEEAQRLKAAYQARKRVDKSLTQEMIADHFNWAGQSAVSQYMNGRIPLNLQALLGFAEILQVQPSHISPRLVSPGSSLDNVVSLSAEQHRMLARETSGDYDLSLKTPPVKSQIETVPVEAWDDETPLGDDEVELPYFKEVELSAGMGSEVMLETTGRRLRFGKRTLQKKNISPESAACVTVAGDSMEPVLPSGCTVAVDTAATAIQDGKMYAVDHSGQLRVKVLYRLPAGGLRIRSYNEAEYPEERYDSDYVTQHIRVIGKVFWYSVML